MLSFKMISKRPNETLDYITSLMDTDKLEREIATNLLASNLERIHEDGKAVDGTSIGTYTPFTKKLRGLSGRQVSRVDLFMTGKLQQDLVIGADQDSWDVGFQTSYGSVLRAKQEKHFNKKIWGITTKDDQEINATVSAFISNPRSTSIF